ncbi:probable LRR receptor-like serine/threonine-protein kinase At3g47570 [Camellia sinensis]|uniref:probable LRR receptor-like serine/threonine-protein kinase At3g47570 n=1 Tax=Camellia sinensis TaxID=4442 RepID=UPI001036E0A0|nr:probable LRR receptor-like serine/threonine-protein kinase At3g47570 [Camellia sinensis]
MEQTNSTFLSCLLGASVVCFIFFFMNSLEQITTAKGNPSLVLTNETDHQALLAIKDLITGDPLGALSSWNHSIHFCNWQGVSCGRRHQRVTALNLSSLALVGSVSPQIGNLTFLRRIDLGNNSFHGEIPQELGKLFRLQYLLLLNNSFQGEFPTNLTHCSHLRVIRMHYNNLRGKIPTELGSLSNLSLLNLAVNHLTGTIPLSIGNLSNLRVLCLSYNNLERSIPTQLGQLSKLEALQLTSNNLSDQNLLTGSIPNSIGKLSMLEKLFLPNNSISGEIPSSLRNLSRLGELDLSTNMIEGSIPISLGNCTNLQRIYLDYNRLIGAISYQIFGLSSLIGQSLSQNYLTGLLPQEVGNLKNLGGLYVSKNKLFGEIPTALGNCEVLELLYVDCNLFKGTIPTAFRQLKGIQELDVSRNNLSGQIPRFLGEFRFFQYLNLSYNMFDGEVPDGGVFTNISAFSIVGNILVVTLTIVVLSLCILAILYRNKRSRQQVNLASPLKNQYPQLSYGELFQATNGFSPSNLIGEGGYGSVYKGILNFDEQIIAVKVLKGHERGANKSFVTECEALKNIRHRNLVMTITACSSIDFKGNDFKALVFDFMENGSLENWLHPSLLEQHEPKNLNFVQRLNIAIDVACALDYLHHHCETTFIHCDLKPSNILLDGDLCAHVSDFGLAKIVLATNGISIHQQSSSIGIRGTIGYVAPEYGMGEEVSTQGDMYSYGVLLLEMLLEMYTGKGPTSNMFTSNVNLHSYVKMCLPEQVMQILDPQIILEMEEEPSRSMQSSTTNISKLEACLVPVFQIGVSCSAEMSSERMSVKDVLKELYKIRNVFLGVRGQRH